MNEARNLVGNEIPSIFNNFLPAFSPPVGGTAPDPPKSSLLGDILGLISNIASFTPFSSQVNTLITVGNMVSGGDSGSVPLATQRFNHLTGEQVTTAFGADSGGSKPVVQIADSDKPAVAAAVIAARSGVKKTILKAAFKAASDIKKIVANQNVAPTGGTPGKPAEWNPQLPVTFADLQANFGNLFGSIALALSQAATATLNGDPTAPGGYLAMVTGGLFSHDPGSVDAIEAQSYKQMVPPYRAYLEDEMFKLILSKLTHMALELTGQNRRGSS